jgi:hypothetical protein
VVEVSRQMMKVATCRFKLRPTVVSDLWIVRMVMPYEFDFNSIHVRIGGGFRFPQSLLSDREVRLLLGREVSLQKCSINTSEICKRVGHIAANVDFFRSDR